MLPTSVSTVLFLQTPLFFIHIIQAHALTESNYHTGSDKMNEVLPALFLGGVDAALDTDLLQRSKVKSVLTVMRYEGLPACYHVTNLPADIEHMHVEVYDSAAEESSLLPHLRKCTNFISAGRQKGGVLVHCFAGVSRSATAVVAYLLAQVRLALERG